MTPRCPEPNKLAAYAHGELTDPAASEIADHVEQCDRCEATVVGLERQGDTVVSGLRKKPVADPLLDEPQCQRAVDLVRELGREPATSDLARGGTGGSPTSAAPALGQLREYKLLEKLGEGGMGAVYKALHTKLKRIVALKVLPAERLQDPHALARFEREMEAVGKLDHPHIVRAMDAGEFNGTHFLVMEYVDGVDLSQLVKQRGPLPIAEACDLVGQAAVGLQHAHEHGLVHRDIKPSNLMLTQRGSGSGERGAGEEKQIARTIPSSPDPRSPFPTPILKILDLGLALLSDKQAEGSPRELTNTGQMMGTLDYMAPEQGSDSHIVDIRADIYSLGATLYKLLTCEVIFSGDRYKTPVQKMMALATQPAPDVRTRRKDVPEALAKIIARMLEKDPAKRPATPAEVAALLAPFCVVGQISNPSADSLAAHIQGADAPRSPVKPPVAKASPAKPAARIDVPPVVAVRPRPSAKPQSAVRPVKQVAAQRSQLPPWVFVGAVLALGGGAGGGVGDHSQQRRPRSRPRASARRGQCNHRRRGRAIGHRQGENRNHQDLRRRRPDDRPRRRDARRRRLESRRQERRPHGQSVRGGQARHRQLPGCVSSEGQGEKCRQACVSGNVVPHAGRLHNARRIFLEGF